MPVMEGCDDQQCEADGGGQSQDEQAVEQQETWAFGGIFRLVGAGGGSWILRFQKRDPGHPAFLVIGFFVLAGFTHI